jgi:hypothetical protein
MGQHEVIRKKWAKKAFQDIRKAYIKEAQKVFDVLKYTSPSDVISMIPKLIKVELITEELSSLYKGCGTEFGLRSYNSIKAQLKKKKADITGDDLTVEMQLELSMQDFFKKTSAKKIITIEETFEKELQKIIQKSIADNKHMTLSMAEYIPYLEKQWGNSSSWMALRIASTETTMAMNYGNREGAKQFPEYQKEKQWLTGGRNIRTSHTSAEENGWIGFDDNYTLIDADSEETALYPGDPSLSASNLCNCKCTEIYRIIE